MTQPARNVQHRTSNASSASNKRQRVPVASSASSASNASNTATNAATNASSEPEPAEAPEQIAEAPAGALTDELSFYIERVNRQLTAQRESIEYALDGERGLMGVRRDGGLYTILRAVPEMYRVTDAEETDAPAPGQRAQLAERFYHVRFHPIDGGSLDDLRIARRDAFAREPEWLYTLRSTPLPSTTLWKKLGPALELLAKAAPVVRTESKDTTGIIRTEDGGYVFLRLGDSALTATGTDDRYMVAYPDYVRKRLAKERLRYANLTPDIEHATSDYEQLLRIAKIAPQAPWVGYALLGAIGCAPLQPFMTPPHVLVYGQTGSHKTAVSRIPLQCFADTFGRSETVTLMCRGVRVTEYGASQILHYLGGSLAVIDDVITRGSTVNDVRRAMALLSHLTGASISGSGADRGMWGKGQGGLAKDFHPQCGMLVTAEELKLNINPDVSTLARFVLLSLDGHALVDMALLTELQLREIAHAMNRATSGYIQWTLAHLEDVREGEQSSAFSILRDTYQNALDHDRAADSYAKLELGLWRILQSGFARGLLDAHTAEAMLAEAHAAFLQAAALQDTVLNAEQSGSLPTETTALFYALLDGMRREKMLTFSSPSRTESEGAEHVPVLPDTLPDGMGPEDIGFTRNDYRDRWEKAAHAWEVGGIAHPGVQHLWELRVTPAHWRELYARMAKYAGSQSVALPPITELERKLRECDRLERRHSKLWGNLNRHILLDVSPIFTERESGEDGESQDSEAESQDSGENAGTVRMMGGEL